MLWGGRFNGKPDAEAIRFSSSLSYDIKLIDEDIEVSKAHTTMLCSVGLITENEKNEILNGLSAINTAYNDGTWKPDSSEFEDIHSAIEGKLTELIGKTAGKLHTGRSRNDQVATGFRLWIRKTTKTLLTELLDFQHTLVLTAEKHTETILPGYTHLQRAQPVSLAFHLLAYVEMFERDKAHCTHLLEYIDSSPLGCGALAGSTLPLDREQTAIELGFSKPSSNALDAVSDRDFVLNFLHSINLIMIHLSKMSEEIILWVGSEWQFATLSDAYSTGSSLMPQKKNPDYAELTRGKTGRVIGNYTGLAATLKSLPLSYNRDLQEDKEPAFDSFHNCFYCLTIMNKTFQQIQFDEYRFRDAMQGDYSLATDLADWIVLKGIPFREAHKISGEVVKFAETVKKKLHELSVTELKSIHDVFDESCLKVFDISHALHNKKTIGSPNPSLIKKEIENWKTRLLTKMK